MAMRSEGLACKGSCHRAGAAMPVERHHIHPQEFHGPSTPDNLVDICSNTHSGVHDLLNRMLREKPYDLAIYTPTMRRLAQEGYRRIHAYAESRSIGLGRLA